MWGSRDARPVRPWSFWRKAFWTRPAFFLGYAAIAAVAVPFLIRAGYDAVVAGHAVATHRVCEAGVEHRCLERTTGQLHGPFHIRRSVNLSWELRDGEREVDGFEVGPRDSDRLAGARDRDVSTLVYDGQVMLVELPGGGDVPTTREGPRGLVQSVCWGLVACGVALGAVRYARKKRRTIGGWWRVSGPPTDAADLLVAAVVLPPLLCLIPMWWGAPWWLALLLVVPLAALFGVSVLRHVRRRAVARHAAE